MDAEEKEFLEELRRSFFDELDDSLNVCEELLLDLETNFTQDNVNNLKRELHSIKGSSRAVDLKHFSGYIHELENKFANISQSNLTKNLISQSLQLIDLFRSYATRARSLDDNDFDDQNIERLLKAS